MSASYARAFFAQPMSSSSPAVGEARDARERIEPGERMAFSLEVRWGEQPLHVAHHPVEAGSREVFVGDASEGRVDLELPVARTCVAVLEDGTLKVQGQAIEPGIRRQLRLGEFTVRVGLVAAARPLPRGARGSRTALAFWIGSAAVHAAILGALVLSPGASLDDETAGLDKSTQAYLLQVNKNHAERELVADEAPSSDANESTNGGSGKAHAGASGQMGDLNKSATSAHYELQGPPDTAEVKMAKVHALIENNSYGAIGALASVFGSTAHTPVAFDGTADERLGRDPHDFQGALSGAYGGDAFGYNGLGPYGGGPGGGGLFDGVGLGTIGDYGHAAGPGAGNEWGGGVGGKPLKRAPKPIKIIDLAVDMAGKLPPDAIKRVIRANFPRFRQCYEAGLKKDPGLKGTVVTRFIIDTTGATESVGSSGGTLSDAGVSACVLGVYRTLSFPEPESGKVMVTYPIDFQNE